MTFGGCILILNIANYKFKIMLNSTLNNYYLDVLTIDTDVKPVYYSELTKFKFLLNANFTDCKKR